MTAPSNPGDATPVVANANRAAKVNESETQANDNETRYLVSTPWTTSVLKGKNFPDVTPKGTEMSATERDAAKKAAKALRLKLRTRKVTGSGN